MRGTTHPGGPAANGPQQTVEWAVLCPRDKQIRSVSESLAAAQHWAAHRDVYCGRCLPGHGKHVAVSRTVSPWVEAAQPDEKPLCRYCDQLPDCAHICDRCQADAQAEHEGQR